MDGPIAAGLLRLRDDHSIEAIYYQDDMPEWPDDQQQYTLVMRLAGSGVHVDEAPGGGFIWATAPPPTAAGCLSSSLTEALMKQGSKYHRRASQTNQNQTRMQFESQFGQVSDLDWATLR